MNSIMSFSSSNSVIILFILSSNSPRYLVPATSEAVDIDIILFLLSGPYVLLFVSILASSSTMAVFPTPASPISNGLFFVLRDSISRTLFISFSLPTTGSVSPVFAFLFRSIPKESTINFLLFFWFVINFSSNSSYSVSISIPIPSNILIAIPSPSSRSANKRSLLSTNFFFLSFDISSATSSMFLKSGV